MATRARQEKQLEVKNEAREELTEALDGSSNETEEGIMIESEEDVQPEEEMLDEEEMLEEAAEEDSKKDIKVQHFLENDEEAMDEDEEIEEPRSKKREIKRRSRSPKPVPQASYIMKLFDRSVNLAKFSEDTPLYPLCREWMRNQPRAVTVKNDKSSDPVIQTVEDGDVVEMPKIRIRKAKQIISKPENNLDKENFDKTIDSEVWTKEKLLQNHRKHWLAEKSRQIEWARLFEEKHFTANLQLLDSLQKDVEEI